MMRVEHVKPVKRIKGRITVIIAALTALLATVIFAAFFKAPVITAETSGSVTIHVYDPQQQYNTLGGWFWLKGSSGVEVNISSSAAADEPFSKSYSDGASTVTNSARTFTVTFTDAQMTKLKGGTNLGMLVCASTGNGTAASDFWTRFEKETPDVFINLSSAFDTNNHADVYYIRKDTVAYTDIEEAKVGLEKVTSARFTGKTNTSVTVEFEATSPIKNNTPVTIYNGNGEDAQEIATAKAKPSASNSFIGTATFTALNATNFDFTVDYVIKVEGIPTGATITKTILIDDVEFINTFESADTQGLEYGAIYSKEKTTFRLWAPFAAAVSLKLYDNGSTGEADQTLEMQKRMPLSGKWGGVWELDVEGDQKNVYYTYSVNNYGAETETIDPYAKACGANGLRGMVVDLADASPNGWGNDKHLYATNALAADTPIVWEVAIADFSSSPDSGMKYKGKYLAFAEQNTTVPGNGTLKTGINYLKDLGITYVHLNPVYDFATVDETAMSIADNTKDRFNWGYDPQNYNIPEGSYSTDPTDGNVRIKEFKQMVMALHNAGIGVIMDVVYNHTYSTSGQALHDTVPYYYHRTDATGAFTDASGCGNETASERTMMRKYMVDSILHWANEYHIDGFRFDLMGIHDVTTISAIRDALDKIDNGNGKRILMYGEPWSADGSYKPASFTTRTTATRTGVTGYAVNPVTNKLIKNLFAGDNNDYPRNMTELPDRVAVFNDTGREGLRGNNDPGQGWVSCNFDGDKMSNVKRMLEGGASGGTSGGMRTGAGWRNVAYAAAHDNFTLWDQLRGVKHGEQPALYYENADADTVKRCKLVSSVYLMSTGISFMLAGEEMGRTKYGNENSYNSPSKLNQITWTRQAEFSGLLTHFKKLIALRKQYSAQLFSYKASSTPDFSWGNFSNENYTTGAFTFTRTQGGATLTMTLNPTSLTGSIRIGSTTVTI